MCSPPTYLPGIVGSGVHRKDIAWCAIATAGLVLLTVAPAHAGTVGGGGGPTASFTLGPGSGCASLTVNFTNTSTAGTVAAITSTDWTFGDGGTSSDNDPVYTYDDAGTYTVTLTVMDDQGGMDELMVMDAVTVFGIDAAFTSDGQSVTAGGTNGFATTPQFGSSMDPFHPVLNPSGTDMPLASAQTHLNSSICADGSFFQTLSPHLVPGFDYASIEGADVFTVIFDTASTNLLDATSFAIAEDAAPTTLPNNPPLPGVPIDAIYLLDGTTAADWVQPPGLIEATKTAVLVNDADGDGKVSPGDTVRYTIMVTNTGDVDATGVQLTDRVDTNTLMVDTNSINAKPVAEDDGYATTAGIQIAVSAPGILDNDFDVDSQPQALTVSAFDNPSAQGGTVNVNTNDGSFTYDAASGFAGTDTFTYEITDGVGVDTATVAIEVAEVADLSVAKADSADPAEGGVPFTYTITVSNAGPTMASGITVTDTLPAGVALGMAVPGGAGFVCSNPVPGTVMCSGGAIASGGVVTIDISVTAAASGFYTNTVTVDTSAIDANAANDAATEETEVVILNMPPVATNDAYTATGNVGLDVPAGSGVLANDGDPDPDPLTVTAFDATSAITGTVNVATNGAFTYTPPRGYTGADSFAYTVSDGMGMDTGTVNLTVSDLVWFVDNGASGSNDGTLANPYNSLASFRTANGSGGGNPAAGDCVFLHADAADYTGGLTLLANQALVGQGATQDVATACGITVHPHSAFPTTGGTKPKIVNSGGNGITLASGNTIRGLEIGNTPAGNDGIAGASVGNLAISRVTVSGTGGGVDLANGTLDVSFDAISSSGSDNGIKLTNTSGSFLVRGDGSTGTQGGNSSGGIISTTTGDGVLLTAVTDVTLQNMTIGDSTATPGQGPNGDAPIAGDGIQVSNSSGLTLNNVTLAETGVHGINAQSLTNLTVNDSLVLNAGNAQEENGFTLVELRGDNFVRRSLFDAFNETGIVVTNTSGSCDLTVDDTTFQDNRATVGNAGEEAILLVAGGTATLTVLVTGNPNLNLTDSIFDDLALQGVQAISEGNGSDIQLTVENSQFLESNSGDALIIMNPDNNGSGNVTVKNCFFTDDTLGPFGLLAKNDSSGMLDVTVISNRAERVQLMLINHDDTGSGGAANGTTRALIQDNVNTIGSDNTGITILGSEMPATGSGPDVSATVLNNAVTLADTGTFAYVSGLFVQAQKQARVNIDVRDNTMNSDPSCCGGAGFELKLLDTGVVGIENLSGDPATFLNAAAQGNTFTGPAFINNPGGNTIAAGNAVAPIPTARPNP